MPPSRSPRRPRGSRRGAAHVRLRLGFVFIAMVLSVFGGRLVQLQGIDPNSYAAMAAKEGMAHIVLPAVLNPAPTYVDAPAEAHGNGHANGHANGHGASSTSRGHGNGRNDTASHQNHQQHKNNQSHQPQPR